MGPVVAARGQTGSTNPLCCQARAGDCRRIRQPVELPWEKKGEEEGSAIGSAARNIDGGRQKETWSDCGGEEEKEKERVLVRELKREAEKARAWVPSVVAKV